MPELFPYQVEGARFLASQQTALLADTMGLGKSAQAVVAAEMVGAANVLVVCPASLIETWKREFCLFSARRVRHLHVSSKTTAGAIQAFIGAGALDDHVRPDGVEESGNVGRAVQTPGPLALDAFDGSASEGLVTPGVGPAAEAPEVVDHRPVSTREGDSPGVGFARRDPALTVDNACHVGEDSVGAGNSKVWRTLPEEPQRAAEHLFVAPAEGCFADRQGGDDFAESFASGEAPEGSKELVVGDREGAGHVNLLVVSYDTLPRALSALKTVELCLIIADEIHYCKNPKAQRTKAFFGPRMTQHGGLVENAKYVWCLTGTPAPNNPSELWPLLHALNPGLLIPDRKDAYLPMNLWQFIRRYCVVKNNGFGDVIVRGQRLDELKERMSPFMLRRRKDEVLKDLPELRFGELPLSSAQADKALARLEHDDVERLSKALREGGAEALSGLSAEMATVRRLTALAKAPAVAEWVNLWLETCDDKIVVFAQHREALDALEQALSAHRPAVVHGGVQTAKRNAEVLGFQHDPDRRVFLGQIQAAGTGLTLTAASDLIFLEQSWTPADNVQAAMRIHRIGQKRGCLVRVAALPGSIDEAVQRTLARKTEDLVQLFDAVA